VHRVDSLVQWLLVAVALFALLYCVLIVVLVAGGRRPGIREIAVFVPDCAVLVARLMRDGRVARSEKLLMAALLVYLAMPIDVVPDFIPVLGQLDDAVVVALVLRRVVRRERPVLAEHWPGSQAGLEAIYRLAGLRA